MQTRLAVIALAVTALAAIALFAGPASAQRRTATGPVTLYGGPAGQDAGNDCLSPDTPCTPQGAVHAAQNNWDWSNQTDPWCTVRLADGSAGPLKLYGQLVGAHVCRILGHVDQNDICIDRTKVAMDFDLQDGAVWSIACVSGSFHGRQFVIMDLADIECGAVSVCILVTDKVETNLAGEIWVDGDMHVFIQSTRSRSTFSSGARIVFKKPVTIPYLLLSYRSSWIEFTPGRTEDIILNPENLTAGAHCWALWDGKIDTGGLTIPCAFDPPSFPGNDGKVY